MTSHSAAWVPLVLLMVAAPIGAFDVLYFHLGRFRLYARPASRAETVTHLGRALAVGSGALLLSLSGSQPRPFGCLLALLAANFVNDIADVLLEPSSRRELGGVPPIEYLVHVVGAMFSGAIAASYAMGAALGAGPVPTWLARGGIAVALGAFGLALFEGFLFVRAGACAAALSLTRRAIQACPLASQL